MNIGDEVLAVGTHRGVVSRIDSDGYKVYHQSCEVTSFYSKDKVSPVITDELHDNLMINTVAEALCAAANSVKSINSKDHHGITKMSTEISKVLSDVLGFSNHYISRKTMYNWLEDKGFSEAEVQL
jgi:hypothetical protein